MNIVRELQFCRIDPGSFVITANGKPVDSLPQSAVDEFKAIEANGTVSQYSVYWDKALQHYCPTSNGWRERKFR